MKSEFAPVEGFDYPRLDTLFLALPIAWKGKVAQYAGRLHRNFEGKTEVQVFDYVDIHVPVLERMYQKRVKSYSAIGYKTKLLSNANVAPDLIYDGKSFYHGFCNDLQNAKSEILIVSPFMRKSRITSLTKILAPIIESCVKITVVTRLPKDFKERDRDMVVECAEKLREHGVAVSYKSDFHQKFTVIDQSVVWYGMDDLTPSYSQTVRLRKLADEGALGEDAIREIMSEEKANQRERIVIYMDDIRQYYPRNMLPKDIDADIKNLLHKRRLEQMRRKENRDAR